MKISDVVIPSKEKSQIIKMTEKLVTGSMCRKSSELNKVFIYSTLKIT